MTRWEREEQELHDAYARGEIDQKTLNKLIRELHREMRDQIRGEAEDAAQAAYDDIMGRW